MSRNITYIEYDGYVGFDTQKKYWQKIRNENNILRQQFPKYYLMSKPVIPDILKKLCKKVIRVFQLDL